jgi:carboxyvinyl-carboxyphosphonate phosphorylmutase
MTSSEGKPNLTRARERFREILSGPGCTPAAPIFDPLSAHIAQLVGWEVCKLSGSVAKAADLAVPDEIPLANMSDVVDICRRITRVADVSLIVDADDCDGNAVNVLRTVRELEAADVSAIEIEDNLVPRSFGEVASRHAQLISKEEQIGKLKAAVAARRDASTVIVARTSALTELPLETALDRIAAYSRTGAEALMFPGYPPRGRADLEAVRSVSTLPILILGLPAEDIKDEEFLTTQGVRIRFLGQYTYSMAVRAIHDALAHLIAGGDPAQLRERQASPELLRRVTRTAELARWEKEYVRE